jgi:hypothetical protein
MTNFYTSLQEKKDYAEALRMAKLQYLRESDNITAAPYFWSGFIFIGHTHGDKNLPMWAIITVSMLSVAVISFFVYRLRNK